MAKTTDWEAIEREYRAGQLSVREIGREHGISEGAIRKRAKAEGWVRDLSEKVRELARAKLVRDAGTQEGTQTPRVNERETIEFAAARHVEVTRQHQGAVGRGRDLTLRLLDELDATTTHVGELHDLIEEDTKGEKNPRRRDGMLRAVSLPGRAGVLKDLSLAAKNWIALERQAFNMDGASDSTEPATKGDVSAALQKLNDEQRDQLRSLAATLAG
jgi:hypothetical protein